MASSAACSCRASRIDESGPALARDVPLQTWTSALLLLFALLALGYEAGRRAGQAAGLLAPGFMFWSAAALWLWRTPFSAWWPAAALAVVTAAGAARAARDREIRLSGPAVAWLFAGLAIALVSMLFVEALTDGAVLSQAHMLDPFSPWQAYAPEESRPTPPFGDVPMLVYPFLAFARERLLEGTFPLWTAAINAGQPFFAAYQSAVLSPLTWVTLAVPLPQATVVIAAMRLLVGGAGMFVFLRGLGLSAGAAIIGGLGYLLNPFTLVWLEHPPGGVPPFLPWMLHAAGRCADGTRFGPAALSLATALVLVAGHPHTGLFCAALAGAYGLCSAIAGGKRRWRRALVVVIALALGVATAAIQILPFLEYFSMSRGAQWRTVHDLNPYHAPAAAIIAGLVPNFFGDHHSGNYAGPLNYLEQVIYAGIPVLVLAGVAMTPPDRGWRTRFFAGAACLALLVVYGAPGINHLVSALPLVKGATLTRMPIVAIASLIVLAAIGADRLNRDAGPVHPQRAVATATAVVVLIGALIAVALTLGRSLLTRGALTSYTTHWSLWALWLAAGTGLVVAARARRVLSPGWTASAIASLLAIDLFVFAWGFHGMLPRDRVFPVTPEIATIRSDSGIFRVLGVKGALMPNSAMVYGLQDIRAYDGLGVAWYAELLDVALTFVQAHQLHEAHRADSPILDLLNVRYLLAPPDFEPPPDRYVRLPHTRSPVYRSLTEHPRTFLVDGYAVLSGNAARRALRDHLVDVRRQVILEVDPSHDARPEPAASAAEVGEARLMGYEHERVVIETRAPGARMLVLTDVFFPGWTATVDGRPADIVRANFAFRAVRVPAGDHRVVFEYAPASFRIGAAISVTALALIVAWSLIASWWRG